MKGGDLGMEVQIVCVNKQGGAHNPHEAISEYGWVNPVVRGPVKVSSRAEMVAYLKLPGNRAFVLDALGHRAYCYVRSNGHTEFLQTQADGYWTDNLVNLKPCYV